MEPDPDEEDDVDWDAISQCADEMEIPESENSGPKDAKKRLPWRDWRSF